MCLSTAYTFVQWIVVPLRLRLELLNLRDKLCDVDTMTYAIAANDGATHDEWVVHAARRCPRDASSCGPRHKRWGMTKRAL